MPHIGGHSKLIYKSENALSRDKLVSSTTLSPVLSTETMQPNNIRNNDGNFGADSIQGHRASESFLTL